MNERRGDMFEEYLSPEVVYVVTTNGYVKNDGTAVMGRGVASIARSLSPRLPSILGDLLISYGNKPYILPGGFVTLPVKHRWDEKADLDLIRVSLDRLIDLLGVYNLPLGQEVYLPRPGCGNGQLSWEAVRPVVESSGLGDVYRLTVWSL